MHVYLLADKTKVTSQERTVIVNGRSEFLATGTHGLNG